MNRVIYEKYCEAMRDLSLALTELLGISLGLERSHFRMFFEDGSSIMRLNSYPICEQGGVALGTGPHCDPTALTILHQDQVGGLEVFANNLWHSVPPSPNALVVNIGDLLMVSYSNKLQNQTLYSPSPHHTFFTSSRELPSSKNIYKLKDSATPFFIQS